MNEEWSEELEECRMYKERKNTIDRLNRAEKEEKKEKWDTKK